MADRTYRIRFEAVTDQLGQQLRGMSQQVQQHGRDISGFVDRNRTAMQTVGTGLAASGAAVTAAMAASVKSAIDFESSFAGVRKTVDGSEEELQGLADGFRKMALEVPSSVNELNAVGEAAGQLGIETPNILEFSRVMVDLGNSTNLSAEEAATALARLANITGMPQTEFDKLGSVIVDLGNNFATTEGEIVEFGLRIAGAGSQIGLTEGEILSIGTALSSVGINAEAGGTAISKVMIEIAQQVATGGDKLENFAEVAGMTTEQFAAAWQEDAAGALTSFITGLGEVDAAGGNTFQVLEDLGISEQRMRDALLRSSGASGVLVDALERQGTAWEENDALQAEAQQRYDTLASQIEITKNNLIDIGITLGEFLMPAVQAATEWVQKGAEAFQGLPDPVKRAIAVLGSVGGLVATAAGGFLLLAPRILDTVNAVKQLSGVSGKFNFGQLGAGAKVAGGLGVAFAAVQVLEAGVDKLLDKQWDGSGLAGIAQSLVATGESQLFERSMGGVEGLTGALEALANPSFAAHMDGFWGTMSAGLIDFNTDMDQAALLMSQWDETIAGMIAGGQMDEAKVLFDQLEEAAARMGWPIEDLIARYFPNLQDQLAITGTSMSDFTDGAIDELPPAFEGAGKAIEGFGKAASGIELDGLNEGLALSGTAGAELGTVLGDGIPIVGEFADETRDLTEATEEEKAATDAAREAHEARLDTIRAATDPVFAFRQAVEGLSGAQRANKEAVDEVGEAEDAVSEARKEHGKKSDEYKEAQDRLEAAHRAVEDSEWDLLQASSNLMVQALDTNMSFEEFDAVLRNAERQGHLTGEQADTLRGQFRTLETQAGDTAGAADELADEIDGVRRSMHDAEGKASALRRALDKIKSKHVNVSVSYSGGHGGGAAVQIPGVGQIPLSHSGGMIGSDPAGWMPGLASDERMRVMQVGEMVIPKHQVGAAAQSTTNNMSTELHVHNPVPSTVEESEARALRRLAYA